MDTAASTGCDVRCAPGVAEASALVIARTIAAADPNAAAEGTKQQLVRPGAKRPRHLRQREGHNLFGVSETVERPCPVHRHDDGGRQEADQQQTEAGQDAAEGGRAGAAGSQHELVVVRACADQDADGEYQRQQPCWLKLDRSCTNAGTALA